MTLSVETKKELLERLKKAAKRQMTAEEIHAQRLSFILGNMPQESGVTKADIEKILGELEGKQAA